MKPFSEPEVVLIVRQNTNEINITERNENVNKNLEEGGHMLLDIPRGKKQSKRFLDTDDNNAAVKPDRDSQYTRI